MCCCISEIPFQSHQMKTYDFTDKFIAMNIKKRRELFNRKKGFFLILFLGKSLQQHSQNRLQPLKDYHEIDIITEVLSIFNFQHNFWGCQRERKIKKEA